MLTRDSNKNVKKQGGAFAAGGRLSAAKHLLLLRKAG